MDFDGLTLSVYGWVESDVHHSENGFVVDGAAHNVDAGLRNELVIFVDGEVCGWKTDGSAELLSFDDGSRKEIIVA